MATFVRGLLLALLTACAEEDLPPEECPSVDYEPAGPVVEDAESCEAETCPLSCDGTVMDCGGLAPSGAVACEPCENVVHYLATECQWCIVGGEWHDERVSTLYCMSDQK